MAKKGTKENTKKVPVSIKWHTPDNIVSRFATNMTAQIVENVMKISFFEAKPKLRLVDSDPIQKEIQADCVASIIISPDKIPSIVDALQKQYDKFKAVYNTKEAV